MVKKKLLYVHNGDFPSTAANRMQVMNMCEAFVSNGIDASLLAFGNDASHIYAFYNIKSKFKILLLRFQKNYYLRTLALFRRFKKISPDYEFIFTRDLVFAYLVKRFCPGKRVIYELHDFSNGILWKFLFRKAFNILDGIVVISTGIKEDMVALGYDANRITVLPDAVNLDRFDIRLSKKDARKRLDLPYNKRIVSYVGSTDHDRDLYTLIKAARNFPDMLFLIYGNKKPYLIETVKGRENIRLMGYTTLAELVYKASDILFSGYTQRIKTIDYMSPLKIFEYMASKTPILVADFPRIRDVLDDSSAFFYRSGDADDLKDNILEITSSAKTADARAASAFRKVKNLTWKDRARRILLLFGLS